MSVSNMLNKIKAIVTNPVAQRGIALVLGAAGITVDPANVNLIVSVAMAASGGLSILHAHLEAKKK